MAGPIHDVGAERHPAHGLDPARDHDVGPARGDEAGGQVVGLLRRAALRVDRRARDRVGQAGAQPRVAGDVRPLLAGLRHAAADHLLDERWIDAGPVDERAVDDAERLLGVHAGQEAAAPADRGPDGLDDHGVAHGPAPLGRQLWGQN